MSTVIERATFPDLGREQFIALTTFRKTGQAVTTPVWFAQRLGTIYVETHEDAGKLKRLRHTARVTLAPCTYSGKVTGAVSAGHARILTGSQQRSEASAALRHSSCSEENSRRLALTSGAHASRGPRDGDWRAPPWRGYTGQLHGRRLDDAEPRPGGHG